MSELSGSILAPLPLLLWRTPPGLELVLSQEGVPFEVVRDPHPFAFRTGRFVLYDGRSESAAALRGLLTHEHAAIDVDALRRGEPVDPFEALVDDRDARGIWDVGGISLRERVARRPKAWIRRRVIAGLRSAVAARDGVWMRLAPFPHPFRSAFNLRVDLDEPVPEDYDRFALARGPLADCCTHFVSTRAYGDQPRVLNDLRRYDAQSHGHYHFVYRDGEANRKNLERAQRILNRNGFSVEGFAAPHGRWNAAIDDALEAMGYLYSSDFRIGYDDFPFFPWKGGRFSRVLQVPVHPICEGLFLDAGVSDARLIGDYLAAVVDEKIVVGEPAFVYGHPERRLGRMPEVMSALARTLKSRPLVWRTTLTEMARWWRWRADRKWLVLPRGGGRLDLQFDEWSSEYPLAVEIDRGGFWCSIPLTGARTVLHPQHLVYEKRSDSAGRVVRPPVLDRRPSSFRQIVREAIDWETETPIDELVGGSLTVRVKKGIRWWQRQRAGVLR